MENILIKACENGNLEEVKNIICSGVDPNCIEGISYCSSDGEVAISVNVTPLLAAVCHKRHNIVEYLLSVGAKVGDNEFVSACGHFPEIIDALIAHGADVNCVTEQYLSGLSNAIISKDFETVKKLVSLGAEINPSECVCPPLQWAYMYGLDDVAEYLIAQGANPLTKEQKQGVESMKYFC